MNDWVKGPTLLDERTIDVFEGTICVILRNGEVYDVRGPGRHGGILRLLSEERRLPVSGSLTILTFERAPAVSPQVTTSVRLRDDATVTVTVQAAIVPLWQKNPDAVKEVVRRHGVHPPRIQEAAQLELEESLRVMVKESLECLTHEQVHSRGDARTLMRLPSPRGLLTVDHLLSCSISRDQHEEGAVSRTRDGALEELRDDIQAGLARLRAANQNEVDSIRRRGELAGRMETAVSEAEINTVTAKLLGIPAVDVAFPAQRNARVQAQFETIRAVLENNMDLLPLLADPVYGNATTEFTTLIGGLFAHPTQGPHGSQRGPGTTTPYQAAGGEAATPLPGAQLRLLRRATVNGPSGPLEIQIVEGSSDRVIGAIGTDSPHRLMIGNCADPVDIAIRALNAAAIWCGVRVGARVLSRRSTGRLGLVSLTRVEPGAIPPHRDVELALGAWVAAINSLLVGEAEVQIDA